MKTNMETLSRADWDKLEQDVVTRIRLLKATAQNIDQNELTDAIAQQLILPALQLLAEFCACVEVTDDP